MSGYAPVPTEASLPASGFKPLDGLKAGISGCAAEPRWALMMCVLGVFAVGRFCVGVYAFASCNASSLDGITVPANGDIIPAHVILQENSEVTLFSANVGVYEATREKWQLGSKMGYFHDADVLGMERLRYRDEEGNYWLSARKPWVYNIMSYTDGWIVERCDDKEADVTILKSRWESAYFFGYDSVWYAYRGDEQIGRVELSVDSAFALWPRWTMRITDPTTEKLLANGTQDYVDTTPKNLFAIYHTWDVQDRQDAKFPTYVAAFLAALGDIDTTAKTKTSSSMLSGRRRTGR